MAIQDETTRKLLNTSTHENFKKAFKKRWPGSESITIDVDQDTQIIKISGYNGYRNGSWEITNKTESESQDEHKNCKEIITKENYPKEKGIKKKLSLEVRVFSLQDLMPNCNCKHFFSTSLS